MLIFSGENPKNANSATLNLIVREASPLQNSRPRPIYSDQKNIFFEKEGGEGVKGCFELF